MGATESWKIAELDWFRQNPTGGYSNFLEAGFNRSKYSFWTKRSALIKQGVVPRFEGHGNIPDLDLAPKEGAPDVRHNKPDVSFDYEDLLIIARNRQAQRQAMRRSVDFPQFFIASDKPVPILFVADWHIGSWGTDYDEIDETITEIKRLNLKVALLGDLLQMSTNMRHGLAALRDDALSEAEQMCWARGFVERFAPQILWVTWDNHVVMRQEKNEGFSEYAELMKDKVIYSNGINHVDLMIGGEAFETYKIASSHRFRGRSKHNAIHGQADYMRLQGIDREIAVAGDSHTPATATYYDGPLYRAAINVGTTQTSSPYAKRFFSLYTHNDMPLVEFYPDQHLFQVYPSLRHYKEVQGL